MHYFFINQYYPPDGAPTGVALQAVAEELILNGHDVSVFCSKGSGYTGKIFGSSKQIKNTDEEQTKGKVRVVRSGSVSLGRHFFFLKLLDYLSFYVFVFVKLISVSDKPDRIIALTTPPYLSLIARLASKIRGADHAHWIMDVYPDVLISHGVVMKKGMAHSVLKFLACWGFGGKRCASVLTIGPEMEDKIKAYLKNPEKLSWVPLWSLGGELFQNQESVSALRKSRGWGENELILMYSGNMGLGHSFDDFLEMSLSLKEGERMVFFGGGKRKREIAEFVNQNPQAQLELHDYVPPGELGVHLSSADVHLVSLNPEWDGVMIPSKLQTIFALKRPVIYTGSRENSIARWIEDSDGGWVTAPNDTKALQNILEQTRHLETRRQKADKAFLFSQKNFSKNTRVRECIESLCKKKRHENF